MFLELSHLEMDRVYVDPVSWVQAVLEDIMEFLENVLSKVSKFRFVLLSFSLVVILDFS